MRVGQNPAKSINYVPQPQKVTVAVTNYIPFLNGYYAQSLEILEVCLGSIWENTPEPYDLLVFDNASCPEVRDFLLDAHRQGHIQYLVLSDRNMGKGGAWNFIFSAAPGEVIAYADGDVCFFNGWLERSLEILEGYPNVGMVTARPLRTPEQYFSRTLEWARQTGEARLEKGEFLPWEIVKEHSESLGTPMEQAQEWYQATCDWRVAYRGLCAYAGAAHFQFIARKDTLQLLLPLKMYKPMGQVRSLDQKLNEDGFLRLMTCEPLVKHMGNRLEDGEARAVIQNRSRGDVRKHLAHFPAVRRSLMWVYSQIFRLYFEGK